MPDQCDIRVLRDEEEECWFISVNNRLIEIDQVFIPLHLIMEVVESTESLCHDNPEDINRFMKELVRRWGTDGYTPTEVK